MINRNKRNVVLIIDDNEDDYFILERYLNEKFDVIYDEGQNDIIPLIKENQPNCILLDYNLGHLEGLELLKIIKSEDDFSNISVIMLTNERKPNIIVECIKNGAIDYLMKDKINREDLDIAVNRAIVETNLNIKIKEQQKEITRLIRVDPLTGLFNRRYFIERVEEEIKRCERGGSFFSMTIIDLDHFKMVNDVYGHLIGDEILKVVATCLKENLRSTDYICRYGGDEYIVVLIEGTISKSDTTMEFHTNKIMLILNKINNKVKNYLKTLPENKVIVTASAGMAWYKKSKSNYNNIFEEADQCLYFVKEAGRKNMAFMPIIDQKPKLYQERK